MVTPQQRAVRPLLLAGASVSITIAPAMLTIETPKPAVEIMGAPCVNGVVPLNPYIVNCNLPPRGPRIRGQAPDAGAIIACRNVPGCLGYYVNYPGQTIWGPFTPPVTGSPGGAPRLRQP
jgi:hypothetical protein